MDLFFPKDDDDPAYEIARDICLGCPVLKQCSWYASNTPSTIGVWGGRLYTGKEKRTTIDLSWYTVDVE